MKVMTLFAHNARHSWKTLVFFPPSQCILKGIFQYYQDNLKKQVVHGCHLHFLRIKGPRVTRVVLATSAGCLRPYQGHHGQVAQEVTGTCGMSKLVRQLKIFQVLLEVCCIGRMVFLGWKAIFVQCGAEKTCLGPPTFEISSLGIPCSGCMSKLCRDHAHICSLGKEDNQMLWQACEQATFITMLDLGNCKENTATKRPEKREKKFRDTSRCLPKCTRRSNHEKLTGTFERVCGIMRTDWHSLSVYQTCIGQPMVQQSSRRAPTVSRVSEWLCKKQLSHDMMGFT